MGLLVSFQNCAPAPSSESAQSDESKPVHKIDSDSGVQMLSFFEQGFETDQARNLLKALPNGQPLAVIVRNGQLYSDVQLIVNGTSFLVSEYLKLLSLFKSSHFTVPVFYSPVSRAGENVDLEVLKEFRLDVGQETDPTAYCDSILNNHQDPSEADLLIQIVDASGMLEGKTELPKVYWTLPVQIFNPATCTSR
jgi:hypothetical protein